MARRRRTELDLNFDSLTDLVTNLAGGFILLVLLLMGVTRPASSQNQPPPPPSPKENSGGDAEQKSMAPLLARVNQIKAQVKGVDQEIDKLKADLPALKNEVEALIRKAEAIQPPKPVKEEGDKPVARTVPFRPPLEQKVATNSTVAFVCQDNRISILDLKAFDREVERRKPIPIGETKITVPTGDFDVVIHNFGIGWRGDVIRKPNHAGETIQAVGDPRSRFQQAFGEMNVNQNHLQFAVFPDSFECFRRARDIGFERGFKANWEPFEPGKVVPIGPGGGKVQG